MFKFIHLAWRNIWRNKRRSLITITAIAFAILMIAVTRSLQYGTYDVMESMAVSLYNGDLQIHRAGFQKEQSLTYFLADDEVDWEELVKKHPQLTGYCRRVTGFGLVSSDSGSVGAIIIGIEPDRETELTKFAGMVRAGDKLSASDDHQVLIGTTMARNLSINPGDSLVVLTQGYQNQMGADRYLVKGLVGVGQAELNRSLMIMPLQNAQDLFSLYGGVTQVVFRIKDFRRASEVAATLRAELRDDQYEILSWEKLMPELRQIIIVDNISGAIYLSFILIVVGIEIFNATMMGIVERSREFGVMQSIGMKPGQISVLLFLESMFKILLALVAGFLITWITISLLKNTSIPLPQDIKEAYSNYGFNLVDMRFSGRALIYLQPLIAVTAIGVLSFVLPLVKAHRLTPVKALHKT